MLGFVYIGCSRMSSGGMPFTFGFRSRATQAPEFEK